MTTITLENSLLHIQILPQGAELCSLKVDGQELLWQADPTVWGRHAPVLFPIVGRLKNDTLIHQGHDYPMSQHGFARDMPFSVLQQSRDSAALILTNNSETQRQYPFEFEFVVHYQLRGSRLCIDYRVSNNSQETLPCSVGAHPAFKWPLESGYDKQDYQIVFPNREPAPIRQLSAGLLKQQRIDSPVQDHALKLSDELFKQDALIFDQLNSHRVTYQGSQGKRIHLGFEDFPHLGVWSKPGANFICIEPWYGYASPDNFSGEFMEKPGLCLIPAFSERIWRHCIEID